jgi:DNA-binding NtrC family response regulator
MPSLWIVHRDPQLRTAIARLAAAGKEAVLGAPEDPSFDTLPPAEVVLLGLADDFEAELQFAHRATPRLARASWILLAERGRVGEAERLFDTLEPEILGYPPEAAALRERIRSAPARHRPAPLPLSQRPSRDALGRRFTRWFQDLDLPELFRALDPQLADVPVLISGEPGTGRSLMARYIHAFGGTASGPFAEVVGAGELSPEALEASIAAASRAAPTRPAGTLCIADADRLSPASQRRLRSCVEFAPPPGLRRGRPTRWIATAREAGSLEPGLRQVLGGLCLRIPPLRDRRAAIAPFANESALAWSRARGSRARRLDPEALAALEQYPWPGNLRELESVIVQTLSASSADPVRVADLQHEGGAFAPDLEPEPAAPTPREPVVEASAEEPEGPLAEAVIDETPLAIAEALLEEGEAPAAQGLLEETEAETERERERMAAVEPPPSGDAALRRLAAAVAHEVRNPLSTIRTFAQLLPERYQDSEFRRRFAELVDQDVLRIEDVVSRLGQLAELAPPRREPVDVAALLERTLDDRRGVIREQRLVVLQELDTDQPLAIGDTDQIRFAFEALLNRCLRLVPAGGDVYVASRHHEAGLHGRPSVRVLVRLRPPGREAEPRAEPATGLSTAENALELAIAESIVRSQGGAFAVDTSDGQETVIVLDLPA